MGRKLLLFTIIAAMLLQPAAIFAEDKKANTNEYKVNGLTYYEINDGKALKSNDLNTIVKQAIYSKLAGQKYTVAEYWASVAAGIISANHRNFYEYAPDETLGDCYNLFLENPQSGAKKNHAYGNLYANLAMTTAEERHYNEDVGSGHGGDIYMLAKGFQQGKSLDDVHKAMYEGLASVNGGDLTANEFKANTSDLIAGSVNKTVTGPLYYNIVAVRDANKTAVNYVYNAFAIVYSDFKFQYASGENGEGLKLPAGIGKDGKTLDDALDDMESGEEYDGLSFSDNQQMSFITAANKLGSSVTQTFTESETAEETIENSVKNVAALGATLGVEMSYEQSIVGIYSGSMGLSWSVETKGTTEEESSVSSTGTKEFSRSTEVSIPPYTSVQQLHQSNNEDVSMKYNAPVGVSYTVTILGYNGAYYDKGNKRKNNPGFLGGGKGYINPQAFVVQFGGGNVNARESLKERSETLGKGRDTGAGLTKLVTKNVSSWTSSDMDSLNWGDIKTWAGMNSTKASQRGLVIPGYDESIKALTTRQPYSLFGARFTRTGSKSVQTIGKAVPLYKLEKVKLANTADRKLTLTAGGDEVNVSTIKLTGIDSDGNKFYGFSSKYGAWKIVDENGNVLEDNEYISLEKDPNGYYILEGLKKTKKDTPVKIKYFVTDKKYQYRPKNSTKYVRQDDVTTPTITVTVKKAVKDPDADASNNANGADAANDANGADDANSIDEPDAANSADEPDASNDAANDAEAADEEETAEEPAVDISQEERAEILSSLSCDPKYCSMAHAALFVKNHIGAQSTVNEQIYTKALLQLAADELDSNSQQTQMETDAVIWAMQEGLMEHIDRNTAYSGITELEFAQLAYKTAVKYGESVSCDDVIDDYSGSESLSADEKKAMNWAISKGILSEKEESSKTLDPGRPMTSAEAAAFCK